VREFCSSTANIVLLERDDGTLGARAEVITIWSEPTYSFDPIGATVNTRSVGHDRMLIAAKGLRGLAKGYEKLAAQLEALEKKHNKPKKAQGELAVEEPAT